MKKIVLVSGLLAGLISIIGFTLNVNNVVNFSNGMLVGYASMLIGFSLIFVATVKYRDNYYGGSISFGRAFLIGLYITLIASSVYVIVWLISYYFFIPDYLDKYTSYYLNGLKAGGATAQEINTAAVEMAEFKEMYKNPFLNALITYTEILPVGLVVSVISAAILKRKPLAVSPIDEAKQ